MPFLLSLHSRFNLLLHANSNSSKFEQLVFISSINTKRKIFYLRKRIIQEQYECINLLTALSLCPFIYLTEMKIKFRDSLKTCFFSLLLMYWYWLSLNYGWLVYFRSKTYLGMLECSTWICQWFSNKAEFLHFRTNISRKNQSVWVLFPKKLREGNASTAFTCVYQSVHKGFACDHYPWCIGPHCTYPKIWDTGTPHNHDPQLPGPGPTRIWTWDTGIPRLLLLTSRGQDKRPVQT